MSKYRTTKTFALQVSNHDNYWGGPKQPTSVWTKLLRIAITLPAIALFLMPSFKIGRAVFRAPTFALPDSVKQGSVFTVPMLDDVTSVQLEGRSLPEVKSKQPMYLVAASASPELDLVLNYKAPEKKLSLKSLIPHFEHPSYDVYTKQIKIEASEKEVSEATPPDKRAASLTPAVPEEKVYERMDGLITASCWKEPALQELPAAVARHGHRPPPRAAVLTAAGTGEVTQVVQQAPGEKSIIVYHGGGLYTRYYGVKDSKVRKGDRITAGLAIATAEAGTIRKPASARWDLFLNKTELNRASFLALSSQLCDLK